MKETRFKTIMYAGVYVDVNLLEKGIYACEKPFLYNLNQSIESLINDAIRIQDAMGYHHVSDKYFDNLRQCKMVELVISEINK